MKKLTLAGVAFAALIAAGPAQAAYTVTAYTGTVGRAFDATLANQSLFAQGTNNASKATFTYSGPLSLSVNGQSNTTNAGDLNGDFWKSQFISNYAYAYGPSNTAYGPGFSTQANFLASSGSISGYAYGSLYVIQSDTGTFGGQQLTIRHDDGVSVYVNGSTTALAGFTAGPTTAITESVFLPAGTTSYRIAYGRENGAPSVLNVSVAAVPEPATWGMMLVGFGMIGATARRRRTAAKVTFA
ncbi:hypothetical protein GGQ80_003574 [Sphingomonas jinjuensis]|uniref:Ice-binding protein C-terminal domain-containing protein n=1 Tax=Sphingomonas jinjuensis TaxID=535907 RepID=A0A840FDG8_9SPHN|nr:PEPxxWA-CTERM sorting domain-containing protein [Sphingomonas jinjuensis]MBB4155649.1 hypothetical protein [Sphingomonas jinjuensis]